MEDGRTETQVGFRVLNRLAAFVAVIIALSGIYNAFAWEPVICWGLVAVAFALTKRSRKKLYQLHTIVVSPPSGLTKRN